MPGMLKDWDDYYTSHFQGYKTKDDVRDGCHPLMFGHGGFRNSIVLVHGLTDSDTTAAIDVVEKLVARSPQAELFKIGRYFNVPHASVVLKHPVLSRNNSPLEPANPFFDSMLTALNKFSKEHHSILNF